VILNEERGLSEEAVSWHLPVYGKVSGGKEEMCETGIMREISVSS
jgi:hypothetical protein